MNTEKELKDLVTTHNISQTFISSRAGVAQITVSRCFRGLANNPRLNTHKRLKRAISQIKRELQNGTLPPEAFRYSRASGTPQDAA